MSGPLSLAMMRIAELAVKDGAAPINALPGCWERVIDDRWTIAVNGHGTATKYGHVSVPSYECYVIYNGWPAGFFGPYGGVIAAGSGANEDALIAALDKALAT